MVSFQNTYESKISNFIIKHRVFYYKNIKEMRGKCNCGKKATCEYLVRDKGTAWTLKFCSDCKPKEPYNLKHMQIIDGK